MSQKNSLHQVKSVTEFENGYWYAAELKAFAKHIGVSNTSKLRKDQLEEIIKSYIQSGQIPDETKPSKPRKKGDVLDLNTVIQDYVSNK